MKSFIIIHFTCLNQFRSKQESLVLNIFKYYLDQTRKKNLHCSLNVNKLRSYLKPTEYIFELIYTTQYSAAKFSSKYPHSFLQLNKLLFSGQIFYIMHIAYSLLKTRFKLMNNFLKQLFRRSAFVEI